MQVLFFTSVFFVPTLPGWVGGGGGWLVFLFLDTSTKYEENFFNPDFPLACGGGGWLMGGGWLPLPRPKKPASQAPGVSAGPPSFDGVALAIPSPPHRYAHMSVSLPHVVSVAVVSLFQHHCQRAQNQWRARYWVCHCFDNL